MAKHRGRLGRRAFRIERLELRTMLASDVVWNNPNWDAAPDAPDDGAVVKGADAFYWGGRGNVGLQLSLNRVAIATENASVVLPEGLTRVWGMGTESVVYQTAIPLTPAYLSEISSIPGVSDVSPVFVDMVSGTDMSVLDEILVGFKPNENASEFFARYSTDFVSFQRVLGTQNQYVGKLAQNGGRAAIDLSNRLLTDSSTEWVHPNFYVNFEKHFIPNDPRFGNLWHLRNLGASGGVPDADTDVELAWDINQGGSSSIVIAVIDDGVQSGHPDLDVWENPGEIAGDGVDNDNNGWIDDVNGWNFVTGTNASEPIGSDSHGTSVAGVAAAKGNNGLGVVGAAYKSPVVSIKVFHDGGAGALDDFASALLYAAGMKADGSGTWRSGDLVNNSWGGGGPFPSMNAALAVGTVQGRGGLGATYFFSSGNNGTGVLGEPAGQSAFTPGVIAIGASTNSDVRSSYSQYGAALDIVSPSNGGSLAIDTTDRTGADGYATGDYTGTGATGFGGTSSASPLAAGIGALALAQAELKGISLSPSNFRSLIRNSTDLIGGVTYNINTGKNLQYGFGRINARTLVKGVGSAEISVVDEVREFQTSATVSMGAVLSGQYVEKTLRIRNQGTELLDIPSMNVPAPFSVVGFSPIQLAIGEATTFVVRFSPTTPGNYSNLLTIQSNDPDTPNFQLRLTGTSTAPSIGGTVFEDYDGDGVYESFERGIGENAFAYIDVDASGSFTPGDTQAFVNAQGAYTFNSLPAGTYKIGSELPGWFQTAPASNFYTITLAGGSDFSVGNDFGFSMGDRMYARVFEDLKGDGAIDGLDLPLKGFVVSTGSDVVTFNSPGPVDIVDGGIVSSPIVVTAGGLAADINVRVNITHTWDSDLDISLVAPDGTEVLLAGGLGLDGDNYTNTVFDDSATTAIEAGAPPFTGTFIPAQPLSAMNNKILTGTWQLKVVDTVLADIGVILDWSMEVTRQLGGVSDANGYALVDLPVGTSSAVLQLQGLYQYTVPANGTHTITTDGSPIYDRLYGARLPNVAPTKLTLSKTSVSENAPVSTLVGKFASTDPNRGDSFTYSFSDTRANPDNTRFEIIGDELWTKESFNYELDQSLKIQVRTTDDGGLFLDQLFTITVLNVNEAPLDIALNPSSVLENSAIGTVVGSLSTTDTDVLTDFVFTYTLVSGAGGADNGKFAIAGDKLLVNGPIDFETQNLFSIRVRSTDAGGLWVEKIFSVSAIDVNEGATVITLSNNVLPENELPSYEIGTLSNNDPDAGDSVAYALVSGAGDSDNIMFKIVGDKLQSAVTFNFEARARYNLRVRATDRAGLFTEQAFEIVVTDVNEAPISIAITNDRVLENMPSNTFVGDLSALDVDAGDSYTISLVPGVGGDDNAKFSLVGTSLSTAASFDFESQNTQKIRVRATDSKGLTYESALVISVLNVNESPTDISVTPDTVPESQSIGTTVGKLTTKDLDNDNVFRYEFANGIGAEDNALFSIVGDELRTLAVFDYDVKRDYSVRIRTTDLGGLSVERVVAIHVSNINDPPTNISLSNQAVAENSPLGTVVGSLTTADADDTDTFIYSLVPGAGDGDNTLFAISGNQLVTNNVFNFEARSVFSVRVRSKDSGGLFVEKQFTINVTNVNEVPLAVRLSKRTIPENSPADTVLGTLTTTDTDSLTDTVFMYSLVNGSGDADNGVFAVSGNQIVLVGSLNFEQKNSLSIRVRSTDLGGLFTEEVFAVSVTNVNEGPTVVNLSNSSIAENQPVGTAVGVLSNDDPDFGDVHTYSLEPGTGGTDNALFSISGDQLLALKSFNFEAKSSYTVRIRATDRIGAFVESVRVITILDVNEAPSSLTLVGGQISENSPIGTEIGTLVGSDPDAGSALFYSLVSGSGSDDNGSFTLVGNKLFTNTDVNFENKSAYSIRARVSDQFGLALEKSFVLSILNVNEQPVLVSLSPNTIFEGMAIGTAVGTLSTVDPDNGDSFSYTLVSGAGDSDNGSFTIVGSQVRSSAVFDFDVKSSYRIRVRTTDAGGLSTELPLLIQVINVNDPPTNISLSATAIQENVVIGTPIGTITTTDADDFDTHTYSLVSGSGDTDNANWAIVGNQLVSNAPVDFEQTKFQQVRIKTVDAGGLAYEKAFVITILDVNEVPTSIGLSGLAIAENSAVGTTVGLLSSTDPDAGDTFVYSLVSGVGGDDNGAFSITGNSLKTSQVFDFESKSSYQIRIRSTDSKGLFVESTFMVTVTNVNEAPISTTLAPASIWENSPAGTVTGTFSTSDPDAGDSWVYSLVSGAGSTNNGIFTIVGNALKATQSLNFESTPTLSVRVRTQDAGGLSRENVFLISVVNQNDAPSQLVLVGNTIAENRPVGTTVGSFVTTDEDAGDTHTYTLVSGSGSSDNSAFTIVGNSLRTNAVFDFETKKNYSIRVATTDSQGASFEGIFLISVTNENEAPSNVVLSPSSILENKPANTLVGLLVTTDVDAGESFSYQIVPQQGSFDHLAFAINGNQLRTTRPFNFEEQSSFAIVVRSTDLGGLSIEREIAITVDNVEEAPVDLNLVGNTIPEGYPPGSPIGTLLAVDPDLAGQIVFSLVPGAADNALFQIAGTQLLSNAIFNFESRSNYSVLVRATDVAGSVTDKSFTILVEDVNEPASSIQLSNTVMPENSSNLLVGIISTNDPDQNETMFYRLVPGAGADDNLQFVIVGDKLYAKTAWDHETKSSYRVRIEGIDSVNHSVVAPFAIQVTDVNDSPTSVTLTPSSIPENSPINTQIGTLNAIDQDAGDTFTFKFADGSTTSPSARFAIVGNKLVALQSFDYETATSYSESIVVTDFAGATFATQLVIAISNVNERPTNIRLSNQAVDENKPIGSLVGLLAVDDVDSPDTATFTLVSGSGGFDNSQFRINGNRLETNSKFNYELRDSYSVRVRVTDAGELTFEKSFIVTINNLAELPPVTVSDNYRTSYGRPITMSVLANDYGVSSPLDPSTVRILTQPAQGTATVLANGSIQYTHSVATSTQLVLQYDVKDENGISSNLGNVVITFYSAFQNQINNLDVDGDSLITPLDPLAIVNYINAHPGNGRLPLNSLDTPPFVDVDGDGFSTPLDVLQVVNKLNSNATGRGGEGEGDAALATAAATPRVSSAAADSLFASYGWSDDDSTTGNWMDGSSQRGSSKVRRRL
ncbi:MAG: choice-of-anchor D domain-containing protein [Planctomycetes bacterium]|nr:choice-of-anchor D domain-containing protein [Planctomycetota bacterium]